ncbi:MAG: nickel pincer cofactor biosynthesis protein LarC [Dehalococcoidia bacterium]
MKAAYVNAIGGASGDMLLASLVDCGLDIDALSATLTMIGASGFQLEPRTEDRQGVTGTYLDVRIDENNNLKRTPSEFINLVKAAPMSEKSKSRCIDVFNLIGEAEGALHGEDPGKVHLHELGTIDTLIDVAGVILGLEMMSVEKVYCSPLPTGSGTVKTQHGLLPVPAPATAFMMAAQNIPCYPPPPHMPSTGEMVTPTGMALLATLADFSQPVMNINTIGYGLGTRNPKNYPNVLAFWIGEILVSENKNEIVLLETNLDDTTGETLGYVQENLLKMGARDVWFTPIQMKKNRPGITLSCLIDESDKTRIADFIMYETSTLGIRVRSVERIEAERVVERFVASVGEVGIKLKKKDGVVVSVSPEYEDCRKIAMKSNLPFQRVYALVQKEAENSYLQCDAENAS